MTDTMRKITELDFHIDRAAVRKNEYLLFEDERSADIQMKVLDRMLDERLTLMQERDRA